MTITGGDALAIAADITDRAQAEAQYAKNSAHVRKLRAEDLAYIVTQPRRIAINEVVIRPTDQA